jgi:hypothetical protein
MRARTRWVVHAPHQNAGDRDLEQRRGGQSPEDCREIEAGKRHADTGERRERLGSEVDLGRQEHVLPRDENRRQSIGDPIEQEVESDDEQDGPNLIVHWQDHRRQTQHQQ